MPDYGNPSYWDERYAAKGEGPCFDWYQDWSVLEPLLAPFLKPDDPLSFEILIPGCGNSHLGADLYQRGFMNITNIDISSVVVNQMADRFKDLDQMEFTQMDARSIELIPAATFDLIIDKALFDSLLCSDDNIVSVNKMVREMQRVLKPGGVYIVISHGSPENRLGYLRRPKQGLVWNVESMVVPKPVLAGFEEDEHHKSHYFYTCRSP